MSVDAFQHMLVCLSSMFFSTRTLLFPTGVASSKRPKTESKWLRAYCHVEPCKGLFSNPSYLSISYYRKTIRSVIITFPSWLATNLEWIYSRFLTPKTRLGTRNLFLKSSWKGNHASVRPETRTLGRSFHICPLHFEMKYFQSIHNSPPSILYTFQISSKKNTTRLSWITY